MTFPFFIVETPLPKHQYSSEIVYSAHEADILRIATTTGECKRFITFLTLSLIVIQSRVEMTQF